MRSFEESLLSRSLTVGDAIERLEATGARICLVVDDAGRLVGTITDGDVRRGLLRGLTLASPVSAIMRREPRIAEETDSDAAIRKLMLRAGIQRIPVVDDDGKVVALRALDEFVRGSKTRENWVLIMAGGLGTRLRPFTNGVPKPLVNVAEKPILKTILEAFVEQGFESFYISVRYEADQIKERIGNGDAWNVRIEYLEEKEERGTAGAIRLLPARPSHPLIVMNGDLLTRVRFGDLLDFHAEREARATMCVSEYEVTIPYGVVEVDGDAICSIEEKPHQRFFVNAGIYVLEPELIDQIPATGRYDMTDLFQKLVEAQAPTAAFPLHEYWLDIGNLEDLTRASSDFGKLFNPR